MNTKTKIFVALAFIVAAFYVLEVVLTIINRGLTGPVFIKAGIVVILLYYAINKIVKSNSSNGQK